MSPGNTFKTSAPHSIAATASVGVNMPGIDAMPYLLQHFTVAGSKYGETMY